MLERRSFLRNLASLPLIGGGITLIGQPTAAAVPVTKQLLMTYSEFCWREMMNANDVLATEHRMPRMAWMTFPTEPGDARRNAAIVLSAAGVPIGGEV